MGEGRLKFFVPPHLRGEVIDIRDSAQTPEEKLEQLTDLAEALTQYIHAVRAGEKAITPEAALTEIAQKAGAIQQIALDEHERAL